MLYDLNEKLFDMSAFIIVSLDRRLNKRKRYHVTWAYHTNFFQVSESNWIIELDGCSILLTGTYALRFEIGGV